MAQLAPNKDKSNPAPVLFMSYELGRKNWRLTFSDGGTKEREVTVSSGDLSAVTNAVKKAKLKYSLPARCRVVSCYEAGRDGFWIHRMIEKLGYENRIIDSSSIEVDRRARQTKTDRVDGRTLLRLLIRHEERGDLLRVVRVPTATVEDERRPHRELERLNKERSQHVNRIKSLLALHGITTKVHLHFAQLVPALRQPDGTPLPKNLSEELVREAQRLELLRSQVKQLEEKRAKTIAKKASRVAAVAAQIAQLRAFGEVAATIYSAELFGWRKFGNRREVGAAAGLDGAPWQSGEMSHDQGIRKAGNRRVRSLAIESAWCWLRYQPQSALSCWYMQRFGGGSGRMRRIGIVALARKLLIAVWRFVDQGIVPDGAILKTERSLALADH